MSTLLNIVDNYVNNILTSLLTWRIFENMSKMLRRIQKEKRYTDKEMAELIGVSQ